MSGIQSIDIDKFLNLEFISQENSFTGDLISGHTYSGYEISDIPIYQDEFIAGDYHLIGPIYNLEPLFQQLREIKWLLLTILLLIAFRIGRSIFKPFVFKTNDK